MLLSRAKPALPADKKTQPGFTLSTVGDTAQAVPSFESLVSQRDFVGAQTILERDFAKALHLYEQLMEQGEKDQDVLLNRAICEFFSGMYEEADKHAQALKASKIQNRLLFHLAHKAGDEKRLMGYHHNLQDIPEDQCCLASVHYLRGHYQEAVDVYKRLQEEYPADHAVKVYLAMCYHRLDYFDISQEILTSYLQDHPESMTALNLKACNDFRLYNGKTAELDLKPLLDKGTRAFGFAADLINHNMTVFREGEGSLGTLTGLLDTLPEARLNLVIWHLRHKDPEQALALIESVDPMSPNEYILKAVCYVTVGQTTDNAEHIKTAQQYFQLVGASASECDTIPGRQCMASCYFLLKQYKDAETYMKSIKAYFGQNDSFNYNFGQIQVALGDYAEAEVSLLAVKSEAMRAEYVYLSHLARCYIHNKKPKDAWDLYLMLDTSSESFVLLQMIANEFYGQEQYLYAARAFDVLDKLDRLPEFWDGKAGACAGCFQQVLQGDQPAEVLEQVFDMLEAATQPEAAQMLSQMKKYLRLM
ncbi:hypothetical protein CXG81DRAFT_20749 [Caulochytrium protostelioides]|uniref:Intraflagellar transport protein 56 n=1 Tax=Caulochytrium protostelioides TaxID=1555241 RepID=A0A4P9X1U3_9FUNG|nr:hypothetical protein CXG81DRAFT_20749 [Caulochytrium protostelioides]|eukprot:RKO99125.1 hypothetical protein CXG81DRAFT_20749 [Caulochytrium protostelioides]